MRIISGKFKGSTLSIPKNKYTRPLKDMVKESIFNLLTHSSKISFHLERSNILDLYSGSGSFGLECLSRQAKYVCFIEKEKEVLKILKNNIKKLKVENKTKIFFSDVFNFAEKQSIVLTKFDLIFCDPPFDNSNIGELIKLIFNNNLLKKNGVIILHRKKNTEEKLPDYFNILDTRIYGLSKIIFGKLLT
tara:strand:- start:3724 stop:4293 length:570 start_codon:yes stop_codon:yes gene_type:complete